MMRKTKTSKEKVMVFCAHSDDQIFGAGGTLAKYAKEGKEIFTVVFSFGEASHLWLRRRVTIEMRVEESQKADKIIGGSGVFFLGLKEGKFAEEIERKDIKKQIKRLISKKKPTKIFTHSIDDPMPDHRAVHKCITSTLDEMGYKCDVYTFDIWNLFNVRERKNPKMYVDITDTFKTKLKALKCFKSQWHAMLSLLWSIYFWAYIYGQRNNCRFAERFYKAR